MSRVFLIVFISTIFQLFVYSQTNNSDIPYSYQFHSDRLKQYITLPSFDINELKTEDYQKQNSGYKQKRFAKVFNVDYHVYNSGEWISTPNGGKLWRVGINSPGAYSIYLVFEKFRLNNGVSLFVYNNDYKNISKTYSSKNNNNKDILPVAPIPGDTIILELNVAPGIENFGEFTLTQIWHDYQDVFGYKNKRVKTQSLLKSGSCENDINCILGDLWQTEKRAVCKIIADGQLCTGTLMNNVRNETIPYFLTAQHCIQTETAATSAIFFFDYESITCNSQLTTQPKILEGSTLVATTPHIIDFALLKLNKFPPVSYKPYLAGWDVITDKIYGGVCIHHPYGDVKKISSTTELLTTSDFGEDYQKNSHWLVSKWKVGVTENGSSGAPLFDKNHHLIGTLTGGEAVCDNPVNDYFTKLSLSWNYYSEPQYQLKHWLDPDNTGIRSIDGFNPYGLKEIQTDSILNLSSNDYTDFSDKNLTWGYISGYNSQKWTQFAEKFNSSDTTIFDEIFFKIALISSSNALSNVIVKIWKGNTSPDELIYSKPVFLRDLNPFWDNIIYLDTVLRIKGNFFIGYEVSYDTPVDTFALYHGPLLDDTLSTMYIMKDDTWINIKDVPGITYPTSMGIGYIGNRSIESPIKRIPKLFPNPCDNEITLETFKKISIINKMICFDMSGKPIFIPYIINDTKIIFDVSKLSRGVYGFKFQTDKRNYWGKIVVIH